MRGTYSVLDIATYFIHRSNTEGKPITNKKLQKLVYYAQVWYLVFYNSKLFDEKIEAWIHGPAVSKLFTKYKDYMNIGIPDIPASKKLSDTTKEFLEDVWNKYGKYDGEYLEQLTHNELPWQVARQRLDTDSRSTKEIDLILAKNYYAELRDKFAGNA